MKALSMNNKHKKSYINTLITLFLSPLIVWNAFTDAEWEMGAESCVIIRPFLSWDTIRNLRRGCRLALRQVIIFSDTRESAGQGDKMYRRGERTWRRAFWGSNQPESIFDYHWPQYVSNIVWNGLSGFMPCMRLPCNPQKRANYI